MARRLGEEGGEERTADPSPMVRAVDVDGVLDRVPVARETGSAAEPRPARVPDDIPIELGDEHRVMSVLLLGEPRGHLGRGGRFVAPRDRRRRDQRVEQAAQRWQVVDGRRPDAWRLVGRSRPAVRHAAERSGERRTTGTRGGPRAGRRCGRSLLV
jgi:hypothetical protein